MNFFWFWVPMMATFHQESIHSFFQGVVRSRVQGFVEGVLRALLVLVLGLRRIQLDICLCFFLIYRLL